MTADARREQVVDRATELIGTRGYWGLSMQDVADACGLTVPGLLRHFHTKTGLLMAVLEHRDAMDTALLVAELGLPPASSWEHATSPHTDVSLDRLCAAVVARNARQPQVVQLFVVLQAESLSPAHPAHGWFMERQRRVHASFVHLLRDDEEPERRAWSVLAALEGVQLAWLRAEHMDLCAAWADLSRDLLPTRKEGC